MKGALVDAELTTALGSSPAELARRLLLGERAAQPLADVLSSSYACQLGALIPGAPQASVHARILGKLGLFAMDAARAVYRRADTLPGERVGLYTAMGGLRAHFADLMGALSGQERDLSHSYERGFRQLHPLWMLKHLSNNAHGLIAAELGIMGDGITYAGANAGAQALGAALAALAARAIDRALVVAYDSLVEPELLVEMAERGALSRDGLARLCAPYAPDAAGAVPGEAAVALLLERPETARGKRLCFVEALALADGREGEPAGTTLLNALCQLDARELVVDGAALAQQNFDAEERQALGQLLPSEACLSALQAATGLLGAATSPIQVVVLATLLAQGELPPIAGLTESRAGGLEPLVQRRATRAKSALGICAGAPGLLGVVRVSL